MLYVYELSFFAFCHWVNILRCSSYFDLCGTGFKCVTRFRALSEGSQQIEFRWVVLRKLRFVGPICEDPDQEGPTSHLLRTWMNMEETQKWWR